MPNPTHPLAGRPALRPPAQAAPVDREASQPAGRQYGDAGIEAAVRCRDMHGLGQQICYATRYGIST